MAKRIPDPTLIDNDNPEWTKANFKKALHAREVLPELFGAKTADTMLKPKRGRPQKASTKMLLSVRYSAEVVNFFKATGPGWQARMDEALKQWISEHA